MKRGEVWWGDLEPTRGREIRKVRPIVILSVDQLNRARSTVVGIPLSNGSKPKPPIVVPTPSIGETSKAICDQVRTLDKSRLRNRIGELSPADLQAIEAGMRDILGL